MSSPESSTSDGKGCGVMSYLWITGEEFEKEPQRSFISQTFHSNDLTSSKPHDPQLSAFVYFWQFMHGCVKRFLQLYSLNPRAAHCKTTLTNPTGTWHWLERLWALLVLLVLRTHVRTYLSEGSVAQAAQLHQVGQREDSILDYEAEQFWKWLQQTLQREEGQETSTAAFFHPKQKLISPNL